jgi:hypothetical protein
VKPSVITTTGVDIHRYIRNDWFKGRDGPEAISGREADTDQAARTQLIAWRQTAWASMLLPVVH